MSKKAGKKQKAKVPEIDPDSPEAQEEIARKQNEAYDMVHRAMIRSQIDAMIAARDDLLKQTDEINEKAERQSRDQNDIYQYLRKKLEDNYLVIADLEIKVSQAHDDRLRRERELLATAEELHRKRESEKTRIRERLDGLELELGAIKEFQENAAIYEQKLKNLEETIKGYKESFREQVVQLNAQVEEEWEAGRQDKEERIKITKKAAAKATQEQLGPKTKHRIAQNKKMMGELRFQCFEVEKMQLARQGLVSSNTMLLAQAASARHGVEEMARRSHLLQRIIRYMYQKLQTKRTPSGGWAVDRPRGARQEEKGSDAKLTQNGGDSGGIVRGEGIKLGVERGTNGTAYRLGGMSQEERQEMLDLREQLRHEEVGIAAAQALAAGMREELRKAETERSRVHMFRADLARVLALCHEDPMLGTSEDVRDPYPRNAEHDFPTRQRGPDLQNGHHRDCQARQHHRGSNDSGPEDTGCWSSVQPSAVRAKGLHSVGNAASEGNAGKAPQDTPKDQTGGGVGATLPVWPEDTPLPALQTATLPPLNTSRDADEDGVDESDNRGVEVGARWFDARVLRAVSRLFLSKLQVAVEVVASRTGADAVQRQSTDQHQGFHALGDASANAPVGTQGVPRTGMAYRGQSGNQSHGKVSGDKWEEGFGTSRDMNNKRCATGVGEKHAGNASSSSKRGFGMLKGPPRGYRGRGRGADQGKHDGESTSIWSDRQKTGIPSWDMLEPAVRQTKRRRTRDAASQTLTYRELRDHANAINLLRSSTVSWKEHENNSSKDNRATCFPQSQFQTETKTYSSRTGAAPNALYSPPSLAPTVSKTSAYNYANKEDDTMHGSSRGGTVHGAIIRGSGDDARAYGRRQSHTQESRIGGSGGNGTWIASKDQESPNLKLDSGHSYRPTQDQYDKVSHAQHRPEIPAAATASRDCGHHTSSPPVSHVSVSWGEKEVRDARGERITSSPSEVGWVFDSENSCDGRRPQGDELDRCTGDGSLRKGRRCKERGGSNVDGGRWQGVKGNNGGYRNGGSSGHVYTPLSKGPDYRKALLFTVDDDHHVLRRNRLDGGVLASIEADVASITASVPPEYRQ